MQIFACDVDPVKAANKVQWEKHVIKMPLETAQMLFSVWHLLVGGVPSKENGGPEKAYRATHVHHPCVRWAQQSLENYRWLVKHGLQLCSNYTAFTRRRRAEQLEAGKKSPLQVKEHACKPLIQWMQDNEPQPEQWECTGLTPFAVAIGEEELARVAVRRADGSMDETATYCRYADPEEAVARAARKRKAAEEKKSTRKRVKS